MAKAHRFWDRIAKKYAKTPIANEEAYQKKLEQTRTHLNDDSEVFEFACGTGTTALYHAPVVKHITAIDISSNMLDIAKEKAKAAGIDNVDFHLEGIDTFDAQGKHYDMVMAHSILHLVDDRFAVLDKVFTMLKPGGVFVSSTACLGGIMPWLRFVLPVGHFFGLLPKVCFFTPDELASNITAAGFEIETRWQPKKTQGMFVIARKPM